MSVLLFGLGSTTSAYEGLLSSWSSVKLCAPMSTPLLWLSVFSTIAEAVNM